MPLTKEEAIAEAIRLGADPEAMSTASYREIYDEIHRLRDAAEQAKEDAPAAEGSADRGAGDVETDPAPADPPAESQDADSAAPAGEDDLAGDSTTAGPPSGSEEDGATSADSADSLPDGSSGVYGEEPGSIRNNAIVHALCEQFDPDLLLRVAREARALTPDKYISGHTFSRMGTVPNSGLGKTLLPRVVRRAVNAICGPYPDLRREIPEAVDAAIREHGRTLSDWEWTELADAFRGLGK